MTNNRLGPGVEDGVKEDSETHFVVHIRDKANNPVVPSSSNNVNITVNVTDSNGSEVPTTKSETDNNGDVAVKYTPKGDGKHIVKVTVNEENINGSPFAVNVTPSLDTSKSQATGPGVSEEGVKEGSETHFTVNSFDKRGNKFVLSPENVKVQITTSNGKSINPTMAKEEDGVNVKYTVDSDENLKIDVSVNDIPVKGSPFTVKVLPVFDINNTLVTGNYYPWKLLLITDFRTWHRRWTQRRYWNIHWYCHKR